MSVISKLLSGVMALDPDASALEFEHRWYSWADLSRAMDAIEDCLGAAGVGPGLRVGVLVRNRPPGFAALLAIVRKRCFVTLNPLLPDPRLLADLRDLQLPAVVGEATDFERPGVMDTLRQAGSAAIVIEADLRGAHLLPNLESARLAGASSHSSDVIIEMLTSGTTGSPKRVPLKLAAFEASLASTTSYAGRHGVQEPKLRSGVELLTSPITHIGGLWGALTTVLNGRKACLFEKFTVAAWRDAVVRHRPKVSGLVPAGLRMILDADIPREDLSSLRVLTTGAAPLDPAIITEFLQRYGIPVLQAYGATEFSGAVAGWTLDSFTQHSHRKAASVGQFHPGVTGRIVDPDTGEVLATGEEGILEMKAAQFGNGGAWLRTTDRALLDEDGFLYIKGRSDSAIIRGGFKVHPDEVAAVLRAHPAVRDAVVVGIKHDRLGEVPVAAVTLKSGVVAPTIRELTDFAKEKLLPYQVPSALLIVDDVPRTSSMKPALDQVRELFREQIP